MVPPCMLAPSLQVQKNNNSDQWRYDFLNMILKYELDVIPYECAEASFEGYEKGLQRKPHGIDYYLNMGGYKAHCAILAEHFAKKVDALGKPGNRIIAMVGIEHSPSCAVNYIYSHKGMLKRSGIFMSEVMQRMHEREMQISYIGINRRYPKKAILLMEQLLQSYSIGDGIANENHI